VHDVRTVRDWWYPATSATQRSPISGDRGQVAWKTRKTFVAISDVLHSMICDSNNVFKSSKTDRQNLTHWDVGPPALNERMSLLGIELKVQYSGLPLTNPWFHFVFIVQFVPISEQRITLCPVYPRMLRHSVR